MVVIDHKILFLLWIGSNRCTLLKYTRKRYKHYKNLVSETSQIVYFLQYRKKIMEIKDFFNIFKANLLSF